jgi:hypothetical protein
MKADRYVMKIDIINYDEGYRCIFLFAIRDLFLNISRDEKIFNVYKIHNTIFVKTKYKSKIGMKDFTYTVAENKIELFPSSV